MVGFKWNSSYITHNLTVVFMYDQLVLTHLFIEKWPSSHLETPGVLVPIRDTDIHSWCLCPKLTRDHLWLTSYSKMKVKLAAQVCKSYR